MNPTDTQMKFLIAEYAQLHRSLAQEMQSANSGFRLFAMLLAGAVASVLLASTSGATGEQVRLITACLSTFFFLVSTLGCVLLIVGQRSHVRKKRAINAIRRKFRDLDRDNDQYFELPVGADVPWSERRMVWTSVVFAILFVGLFAFGAGLAWSLCLGQSMKQSAWIAVVVALGAAAVLGLYLAHVNQQLADRGLGDAAPASGGGDTPAV